MHIGMKTALAYVSMNGKVKTVQSIVVYVTHIVLIPVQDQLLRTVTHALLTHIVMIWDIVHVCQDGVRMIVQLIPDSVILCVSAVLDQAKWTV